MKTQDIFHEKGIPRARVLKNLAEMERRDNHWKKGKMFGYVFHPGDEYAQTMEKAYNTFLYESTLNPSAFPSLREMETEAVGMIKELLHGDHNVAGSITSGGTESILMAMKVARDEAINSGKTSQPELIIPCSAHPAFDKSAHYLGIKVIHTPVNADMRADVDAIEKAVSANTVMVAASAPSFPHGVVDPITEIGDMAKRHGLFFHVDACMGGFMLPFLEELKYNIPLFDFRVNGVTSISVDAHKYGYACKGASFILYRNSKLRKRQFFVTTDWPGGVFASSTFLGTKSGGPIAATWTIMHLLGKEGYRKMAGKLMESVTKIKNGINAIAGLSIIGNPHMSILSFCSETVNIFSIGNEMQKKGWFLDRIQFPDGLHMTVNQVHCGIEDDFLTDLAQSYLAVSNMTGKNFKDRLMVAAVKSLSSVLPERQFRRVVSVSKYFLKEPAGNDGNSVAMYGITSSLKNRENLKDLIIEIYDSLYTGR